MNSVAVWFRSLQQRERMLVVVAGGLIGAALLYLLLFSMFGAIVDVRTGRVERKQQDLVWMRSVAPTVRSLAMAQPGGGGESLVVLIDRTARTVGLASALTAQTPNGDKGMRVRLENANFDAVIVWLAMLHDQYGVGVESATVDRSDKPGLVNASVVLIRSGHG